MIAIIDYGMGNSGSILNMIRKVGLRATITSDLEQLKSATHYILPGVGTFDNGMSRLRKLGLLDLLNQKVVIEQYPFLGICLGMQLLFERSEEGSCEGLGWIKGQVKRFSFGDVDEFSKLKVPHMGWNQVCPVNRETLYRGLDEPRFYFVHSYHVICAEDSNISATTEYGYQFTCSVQKNNIFGVQFHPEKSHRFGLNLLKNFLEYKKC